MKASVIFLLCLMFTFMAIGQNEVKEIQPEFTGAKNAALQEDENNSEVVKYCMQHIKYPDIAVECCIEGTEVVEFMVTPKGKVTDFNIINSVCCEIDDEVIRVLEKTNGMWKPGEKNGQPVAMKQEIAFAFSRCRMETGPIFEDFTVKATNCFARGNQYLLYEKKPKKALRAYNSGIRLMPYEQGLFYMRGLCKYELGDKEGAREDWDRLRVLGGVNNSEYFTKGVTELKGYKELITMLEPEEN